MNIKKLSAALLAAAMMITSGLSVVRSVTAASSDVVMISLTEYNTRLAIDNKTNSELAEGITIGELLDGMVYRGSQTDKEGNPLSDGDSVMIPGDATVVWVGDNQYSIYDRDVKVYLQNYQYYDIIVGSGKQLDPNNIVYHLRAEITPVKYVIDWDNSDIKLYNISEDGTEEQLDYEIDWDNDFDLYLDIQKKVTGGKVMADISGLTIKRSNDSAMPEHTLKVYGSYSDYQNGNEVQADDKGRKLVKESLFFYLDLVSPDGTSLFKNQRGYIRMYYPQIDITGYFDFSSIYDYDFTKRGGENSISYEYTHTLSPGKSADNMKFRIQSFENGLGESLKGNGNITKSVKGNYDTLESAADEEDITGDLFSNYSYLGVEGDYVNGQEFTVFLDGTSDNVKGLLDTEDAEAYVVHIKITAVEQRLWTRVFLVNGISGGNDDINLRTYSETRSGNKHERTDRIYVPATAAYESVGYSIFQLERSYDNCDLKDEVTKAVKGKYASSEAAAGAEEISISDLFDSSKGYTVYLTNEIGEDITIFLDAAGDSPANALCEDENSTEFVINIHIDVVKVEAPSEPEPEPEIEFVDVDDSELPPDIKSTNFKVTSVSDESGARIRSSLGLHSDDEATYFDTYGKYGTQTIFVFENDGSSVDLSKIKLNVTTDWDVRVFLIEENGTAKYVNLDEEIQDFSDGKIKHYATAKRGEGNKYYKQGNYYVSVKTKNQSSAELFVEGPSDRNGQQNGTRTLFFDAFYGKAYHDIVIANLGNAPLQNLTATLTGAKGIKLNGFWNLSGEYPLAPTTVSNTYSSAVHVENMAKIRIEPETDENGMPIKGDIEGTLTISADGQPTYTIKLSGQIKDPEITTSELSDAVKYVPYSSIIGIDTIHKWLTTIFEVTDGDLPDGLTLNPYNGELYGVPREYGEFTFLIKTTTYWSGHTRDYPPVENTKAFTLTVKENTDENVYNESDEEYTIKTSIGTAANQFDFVLPESEAANDQIFTSNGEYGNFIDFWLNGKKLIPDTDYTSEEGSTKITIKSQTMSKLPKGTANTIAAEFRVDGDTSKELKKTAQNFTIKSNNNPGSNPSNPGTPSVPSLPSTPTIPSTPGIPSIPSNPGTSSTPGTPGTSDSTSAPGTSDNTSNPGTTDNTSTPDTSDNTSSGSGDSDNTPASTPTENDVVFKPVPTSGELADIINNITIFAPHGVMPEDAVLIIEPDGSIPADKSAAFDIEFTLNGEKVQPNGSMTVRIPIPDDLKGLSVLYVYHIIDGKYNFVESWIDGDYVCFKADGFSTYVVSGKKLDSNGNEIIANVPGSSENPSTGMGISVTGLILSSAALIVILLSKKNR